MIATTTRPARSAPTLDQWQTYQRLFDYFNDRLFGGELPPCVLNFSRWAKSHGVFILGTWVDARAASSPDSPPVALDEISLNPDTLYRPARESLSTLVHEMVHLWQFRLGDPPRRGYHDREFADKMESVGLMTSTTGAPGGKRTGQNMTHYIIDGGAFDAAFAELPAELLLPWKGKQWSAEEKKKREAKRKTAYVCPGCEAKVWGKPEMSIKCGECGDEFEAQEPAEK